MRVGDLVRACADGTTGVVLQTNVDMGLAYPDRRGPTGEVMFADGDVEPLCVDDLELINEDR